MKLSDVKISMTIDELCDIVHYCCTKYAVFYDGGEGYESHASYIDISQDKVLKGVIEMCRDKEIED
jgi:hypothetical protein